jgi:hypothetical protein
MDLVGVDELHDEHRDAEDLRDERPLGWDAEAGGRAVTRATETTRRAVGATAGIVLFLLGTTGCAAATSTGSIRPPDGHTEVCSGADEYTELGVGFPLDVVGDQPVTIDRVRAEGARHMTVRTGVVVPVGDGDRVGTTHWPVPAEVGDGETRPAAGAVVRADVREDLVVHLRRTAQTASVDRLVLDYTDGDGVRRSVDLRTVVSIRTNCS